MTEMFKIVFVIGNALILCAGAPNIIKLIRYWDVRSFSKIGALLTWLGLTMFTASYLLNEMWVSLLLSAPGMFFWGAITGVKFFSEGEGKKKEGDCEL